MPFLAFGEFKFQADVIKWRLKASLRDESCWEPFNSGSNAQIRNIWQTDKETKTSLKRTSKCCVKKDDRHYRRDFFQLNLFFSSSHCLKVWIVCFFAFFPMCCLRAWCVTLKRRMMKTITDVVLWMAMTQNYMDEQIFGYPYSRHSSLKRDDAIIVETHEKFTQLEVFFNVNVEFSNERIFSYKCHTLECEGWLFINSLQVSSNRIMKISHFSLELIKSFKCTQWFSIWFTISINNCTTNNALNLAFTTPFNVVRRLDINFIE